MLTIRGLSKSYRQCRRVTECLLGDSRRHVRSAGPQRRRQVVADANHRDAAGSRLPAASLRRHRCARRTRWPIRRTLGYLPQDFGVYPKVSALGLLDHLAVLKGYLNRGERADVVEALLRQVNLWDVRKRKLGTFSGGMRQRFGIAQALLGNPNLVIVDEPTAGLDPEERNRFLNLLADIGGQVVVILSTHIVEDVTDLCPRMAMICRGEVLMSGEPHEEAIAAMRERVWSKLVSKATLPDYQSRYTVLSTRLIAGEPLIHVV